MISLVCRLLVELSVNDDPVGYRLVFVWFEFWLSMCALFTMRLALDDGYDLHAAYSVVKVDFCHVKQVIVEGDEYEFYGNLEYLAVRNAGISLEPVPKQNCCTPVTIRELAPLMC